MLTIKSIMFFIIFFYFWRMTLKIKTLNLNDKNRKFLLGLNAIFNQNYGVDDSEKNFYLQIKPK